MKCLLLSIVFCLSGSYGTASQFEGSFAEWQKNKEDFEKPEASFKKAFDILKAKYVDKNLTEGDLYRAATEGMLASLNVDKPDKSATNEGVGKWNELLSPLGMKDMQIELTGKLVGIGATLSFDKGTGDARVEAVLPGSAALKAGLKKNDYILSVNGKRYKKLQEMVADIRGKAGDAINLKVLREDNVLDMKIARAAVEIPMFASHLLSDRVGYLKISGFSQDSAKVVREKLSLFDNKNMTKLIIDLRENNGGAFDPAIDVIDLFLQKGEVVGRTKNRAGDEMQFRAKGQAWKPDAKIVVLTSPDTRCAAELMAASLKENRGATLIGGKTTGKWTVESVENLPNNFAIKYSVLLMESPQGKSYEGEGLSPDFEIAKSTKEDTKGDNSSFDFEKDIPNRIAQDPVLKAAVELK